VRELYTRITPHLINATGITQIQRELGQANKIDKRDGRRKEGVVIKEKGCDLDGKMEVDSG